MGIRLGLRRAGRHDIWIFLAYWILAVAPGIWATRDLHWPYDADGFRDVSIAQRIREGEWLRDPAYKGEAAWYGPVVPAIAALLSAGLNVETPQGHAQTGAYVNAVVPLTFWLFVKRLLGPWPALFAAGAFMFLPGRPPPWAAATYSPWLFPSVTAQIPLYAGLAIVSRTADARALVPHVWLGIWLAATFLAHAAGGILLAAIGLATSFVHLSTRRAALTGRGALAAILPYASAALLIAPFLLPIAARYGFEVLNRAPATWSDESMQLVALFVDVQRPGSVLQLLLAVWGAVAAYRTRGFHACFVLSVWGSVSLLGYWYALLAESSAALPTLVPGFHFYFLLRAWKWVLLGSGISAFADAASRRLQKGNWARFQPSHLAVVVAVLFGVSVYPRYLGREAFTRAPEVSRELAQLDGHAAYEWIRAHTDSSAVFLSSDEDALRVVGPAGRFVVCVSPAFSNPYVDYEARSAARDALFRSVMTGDRESFGSLNQQFGVTYVLARADDAAAIRIRGGAILEEVFAEGSTVIFKVGVTHTSKSTP